MMFGTQQQQQQRPTTMAGSTGPAGGSGTTSGFNLGSSGTTSSFNLGGSGIANQPLSFGTQQPSATSGSGLGFSAGTGSGSQPSLSLGMQQQLTGASGFSQAGVQTPQVAVTAITRATKFNELPDLLRKQLVELHNHIMSQGKKCETIKNTLFPDSMTHHTEVATLARAVSTKLTRLNADIETDERTVQELRRNLEKQRAYLTHASRVSDAMENDDRFYINDKAAHRYFRDLLMSLQERLDQYEREMQDLERHLSAMAPSDNEQDSINSILDAVQFQHSSFLVAAGKVAALHAATDELRKAYIEYRQTKFGNTRNPFVGEGTLKKETSFMAVDEEKLPIKYIASNFLSAYAQPPIGLQQQPQSVFQFGNTSTSTGPSTYTIPRR